MNRIVIIGNGFDLAHGLKTSYTDFFNDYWENTIYEIRGIGIGKSFENDEIKINIINTEINESIRTYSQLNELVEKSKKKANDGIHFNNRFFKEICTRHRANKLWVDIENIYYELLVEKNKRLKTGYDVKQLNFDFGKIKNLLIKYLLKEDNHFLSQSENTYYKNYSDLIISKIIEEYSLFELSEESNKELCKIRDEEFKHKQKYNIEIKDSLTPKDILLLNFNYTSTINSYSNRIGNSQNYGKVSKFNIINIHGNINLLEDNPVIFGYGDEMDEDYKKIENLKNNRYLENVKSIKYLETGNYKELLRFIETDFFQIYIYGHSCGNSDRTLLNTIFEHNNCASIKVFYHKEKRGDNYSEIIKNISRNFSKKPLMRDRVVNKTKCEPLPQLNAKIY